MITWEDRVKRKIREVKKAIKQFKSKEKIPGEFDFLCAPYEKLLKEMENDELSLARKKDKEREAAIIHDDPVGG